MPLLYSVCLNILVSQMFLRLFRGGKSEKGCNDHDNAVTAANIYWAFEMITIIMHELDVRHVCMSFEQTFIKTLLDIPFWLLLWCTVPKPLHIYLNMRGKSG